MGLAVLAARFIIIGVQKKSPFEVWQFEVTPAPGLIEQGRKKYERLMKAILQQQGRPVISPVQGTPAQAWASAYSRMEM